MLQRPLDGARETSAVAVPVPAQGSVYMHEDLSTHVLDLHWVTGKPTPNSAIPHDPRSNETAQRVNGQDSRIRSPPPHLLAVEMTVATAAALAALPVLRGERLSDRKRPFGTWSDLKDTDAGTTATAYHRQNRA